MIFHNLSLLVMRDEQTLECGGFADLDESTGGKADLGCGGQLDELR
jgi:hypothetical protein